MRIDLVLTFLLATISVIIWSGTLALGISLIVKGVRRKLRTAKIKGWFTIIAGSIVSLMILLPSMGYLYVESLWFMEMGYSSVFWKMTFSPWKLFVKYALIAAGFLTGNFFLAQRLCPIPGGFRQWATGKTGSVYRIMIMLIVIISIIMGSVLIPMWDDFLRYHEREPFVDYINESEMQVLDPQFGRGLDYYLFTLPVRNFISFWTKALFWINILLMLFFYNFLRYRDAQSKSNVTRKGVFHLSVLWLLILVASIWRSVINMHRLVYSGRGATFGAGYTDVHIQIPVYRIYIVLVILVGLAVCINAFFRKRYLVTVPIVLWFVGYVILIWSVPYLYQRIKVEPNEANWEREYITRTIRYTRIGYGLHKVKTYELPLGVATLEKIKSQEDILKNVQLWDRRTVRDTLTQVQALLPYYVFWAGENDDKTGVDADRYVLTQKIEDGGKETEYRQVMIAARELDSERLPKRTWVNLRLIYTHGYGVCLGSVNEFTNDGQPYLWVKNVPMENPPEIKYEQFDVNRMEKPQVYYGEVTKEYVFVRTSQQEFDHPRKAETGELSAEPDETKQRYIYEGSGGVPLKSIFRRLMLAFRFWDYKIVTSEDLSSESRIMFHRQIQDRVKRIAPFLGYDEDPYIVVGDSGKLWWVIDAYITSKNFPYSTPYSHPRLGKFNYIRNPLKAVIDAYNGQVSFYIWNEDEVLSKVYRNIFPGLFKSREDMPDGLDKHNRYPDDLTAIQARQYCLYHMNDPQSFYGEEDKWDLPYEVYHQEKQKPMVPLYVMIRLPGEQDEEFVSIMPFTPWPTQDRPNMVAWMAVRNDKPGYGDIMVYILPKGVPGPAQIESRIDTDPSVSEKLALWDQRGSRVIRGNLLTIPVGEDALFYVEPLYLQDETINMPLLKQVIVAAGDKVALAENFDDALEKVFQVGEEKPTVEKSRSYSEIIKLFKDSLAKFEGLIAEGKSEEATKELEQLGKYIRELRQAVGGSTSSNQK